MSKILLWIADNSKETIFSLVLGGLITTIFQNRKNIVIWIKTFFQKEKEFRISYAYLFRIKIENKYFFELPENGGERAIAVVRKVKNTPQKYPRQSGKIKAKAL